MTPTLWIIWVSVLLVVALVFFILGAVYNAMRVFTAIVNKGRYPLGQRFEIVGSIEEKPRGFK